MTKIKHNNNDGRKYTFFRSTSFEYSTRTYSIRKSSCTGNFRRCGTHMQNTNYDIKHY
jgi:hypothetical protein